MIVAQRPETRTERQTLDAKPCKDAVDGPSVYAAKHAAKYGLANLAPGLRGTGDRARASE